MALLSARDLWKIVGRSRSRQRFLRIFPYIILETVRSTLLQKIQIQFYVAFVVVVARLRRRDSSRKMMAVSFEVSKISWTNFLVTRTHRRILCWSCDYRERSNLKINKYRGNRDIFVEFFVETQLFVFNNRSHVFPFKRVLAKSHVSS